MNIQLKTQSDSGVGVSCPGVIVCTAGYIRGIKQKKESSLGSFPLPAQYYYHKIKGHLEKKETL